VGGKWRRLKDLNVSNDISLTVAERAAQSWSCRQTAKQERNLAFLAMQRALRLQSSAEEVLTLMELARVG
jgi:hypothetical protein